MKKFLLTLTSLVFAFSVSATQLKEGVHYEVFESSTATSKPEIKEYFSFYCPHCYSFEPLAKRFKENAKSGGYKFVKSHVDFLRAAGPEVQLMLTKANVVAEMLNVPGASTAIFDYIHNKRGAITSKKDIRNIFLLQGVDGAKFDKAFDSFAVTAAAKKAKQDQDALSRARVLTGVPTFVVNGKYKILNGGFDAKTYDELFSKIEQAAVQLATK